MNATFEKLAVERECRTCRRTKDIDQFVKDRRLPSGRCYQCKECSRERYQMYSASDSAKSISVVKQRESYRSQKPGMKRARRVLRACLANGELTRPEECSICLKKPPKQRNGSSQIHGHHADYRRPKHVIWCCVQCHRQIHSNETAVFAKLKGNANG